MSPGVEGGRETMMMIGRGTSHHNPTVHVHPLSHLDDPAAADGLFDEASLAALQLYFGGGIAEEVSNDAPHAVDAYTSDEFRMYEFKVRRCPRGRAHDWTECPFAHPGEKARRRDVRKHPYSGAPCPDYRKAGGCRRGDACELSHGVFECWLHPDRYRTQPCKDGTVCRRRVCFFAHTPDQLRSPPPASPDYYICKNLISSPSSPASTESPPISPSGGKPRRESWRVGSPVNDIVASLRQLQLERAKLEPSSWALQVGTSGLSSPRGVVYGFNAGSCSTPSTPMVSDGWPGVQKPAEMVESGRALRAMMFENLSKDRSFEMAEAAPDVEWVSELLK